MLGRADANRRIVGDKFHFNRFVVFASAERNPVLPCRTGQKILRQIRAVNRTGLFVACERYRTGISFCAQHIGACSTSGAGPHDDDGRGFSLQGTRKSAVFFPTTITMSL